MGHTVGEQLWEYEVYRVFRVVVMEMGFEVCG
jgi:hypothetical protein